MKEQAPTIEDPRTESLVDDVNKAEAMAYAGDRNRTKAAEIHAAGKVGARALAVSEVYVDQKLKDQLAEHRVLTEGPIEDRRVKEHVTNDLGENGRFSMIDEKFVANAPKLKDAHIKEAESAEAHAAQRYDKAMQVVDELER